MRGGRASVLRLCAPLAAVLTFAAPAQAGSSSRPDPPPGASVLQPDASPSPAAAPAPAPKRAPAAFAPRAPVAVRTAVAVVLPPTPARRSAPVQHAGHVRPKAKPRAKPKPAPKHASPRRFEVPRVVVPRFLLEPLERRSSGPVAALAALALGAAALTALSGAGLVVSWSRR